jgi:hypothetical protein
MVMRYHYGLGVGHTYASRPSTGDSCDNHCERGTVPDEAAEGPNEDDLPLEQDKDLDLESDGGEFQDIEGHEGDSGNESNDGDDDEFLAMDEMYGDHDYDEYDD